MAATQNPNQAGWFYHAPSKPKQNVKPVDFPAPSQIPGLSGDNLPYNPMEEPKKMLFKESDSKYIRMAKQGGHDGLLRMRTPKGPSKEAKPYPRTDWYYLEDNRIDDEREKTQEGPYEFSLPDYMVHHEYKPRGDGSPNSPQRRNPLSRDTSTVYQREGGAATDKTVRLPEARPSGYGVRQEKQNERKQRTKAPQREPPQQQRPNAKLTPKVHEEERPLMSKILSFGYGKDDLEERQKYAQKYDEEHSQPEPVLPEPKMSPAKKGRTPQHGRRAGSGQVSEAGSHKSQRSQYARQKPQTDKDKPDFFKLSKFDKVPAKVQSHRPPAEDIQPMAYDPTRDLSDLHRSPQPVACAEGY